MGLHMPSLPDAVPASQRGGSLPATSKERESASALRRPWCNRKRASDLHGRGRVRPAAIFVSGAPQSAPDTQDLPPPPVSVVPPSLLIAAQRRRP